MDPYKERVVKEAEELGDRIVALQTFLSNSSTKARASADELVLLGIQYRVMQSYHGLLLARRRTWPPETTAPVEASGP